MKISLLKMKKNGIKLKFFLNRSMMISKTEDLKTQLRFSLWRFFCLWIFTHLPSFFPERFTHTLLIKWYIKIKCFLNNDGHQFSTEVTKLGIKKSFSGGYHVAWVQRSRLNNKLAESWIMMKNKKYWAWSLQLVWIFPALHWTFRVLLIPKMSQLFPLAIYWEEKFCNCCNVRHIICCNMESGIHF